MYGPSALEMLANVTQQLVTVQTSAGWACRNAGLWIGEQGPSQQDDPDMDDWLAKRFGKSKPQPARRVSPERAIRSLKAELPVTAVRAEDSPRTASWRAAVAEIDGALRPPPSRMRSSSPTLENWLARRTHAKGTAEPEAKSKRASSVPAPRTEASEQKREAAAAGASPWDTRNFREILVQQDGDRRWAEILEDDQAKDEDDLFKQLQDEQDRLRQDQSA